MNPSVPPNRCHLGATADRVRQGPAVTLLDSSLSRGTGALFPGKKYSKIRVLRLYRRQRSQLSGGREGRGIPRAPDAVEHERRKGIVGGGRSGCGRHGVVGDRRGW